MNTISNITPDASISTGILEQATPPVRAKSLRPATRFMVKAMAAVLAVGLVSGCVTDDYGTKSVIGSAIGAGLGGYGGSKLGKGKGQLAAIAVGALAGGLFGNSIGGSLDRADRLSAERAQNQALVAPVGQPISWSNPSTGNAGTVTTTREGTNTATGAYCREYHTDIQVGGQSQSGYGTACRMPDGSWQVKS